MTNYAIRTLHVANVTHFTVDQAGSMHPRAVSNHVQVDPQAIVLKTSFVFHLLPVMRFNPSSVDLLLMMLMINAAFHACLDEVVIALMAKGALRTHSVVRMEQTPSLHHHFHQFQVLRQSLFTAVPHMMMLLWFVTYRVQVVDLTNVLKVNSASLARRVAIEARSSAGQRGQKQQRVAQHHARVARIPTALPGKYATRTHHVPSQRPFTVAPAF